MLVLCVLLARLLLYSWNTIGVVAQDNITCVDSGSDWYTNFVGETPCRTYERLRQICNSHYQIGQMNPKMPPDVCNEQVADCCCNSIAFALSMLCITCQRGIGNPPIGYDAAPGTYQRYLSAGRPNFCSPNTNKTLPVNIQKAVCNTNLKLADDLYGLFWVDGAWFYTYTREAFTRDANAHGDGVFSRCNSTTTSSGAESQTATSSDASRPSTGASSAPPTSSQGLSTATKAGIAVGAVILAALITLIVWLLIRQRKIIRAVQEKSAALPYRSPMDGNGGPYSPVASHSAAGAPFASSVSPYTSAAPTEYTVPSETIRGSQDTSVPSTFGPQTLFTTAGYTRSKRTVANPSQSGGSSNELSIPVHGLLANSSSAFVSGAEKHRNTNTLRATEDRPPLVALSPGGFSDAPPAYS